MLQSLNSIKSDALVICLALLASLILIAIPPLDLGGVWVWFFALPLFFAARLLSTAKFLLLFALASLLAYGAFAISLDRFLAINFGTTVFFILFSLLVNRDPSKWLFQSVLMLHLLVDLPLQVVLRKMIGSTSWLEACFTTLGYSVGMIISLVIFSAVSSIILNTSESSFRNIKRRLSKRPNGSQIVELVIAAILTLLLLVYIAILGKNLYKFQQELMRADIKAAFNNSVLDYKSETLIKAETSLAVFLSLGDSYPVALGNAQSALGLVKQIFFVGERDELIDSTSIAVVTEGKVSHEKTISIEDVENVITLAQAVGPAGDLVVFELAMKEGPSIPAQVLSVSQGTLILFYRSREAFLAFQERALMNPGASNAAAKLQRVPLSQHSDHDRRSVLTNNELHLFVGDDALIWESDPNAERVAIKSSPYLAMREGRYPRWLPFGEKTLFSQFFRDTYSEEVKQILLQPEDYSLTVNYWQYFGVYTEVLTIGVLLGLMLIAAVIPLCRLVAEGIIRPLEELTRVLDNWSTFRGGEFGSSTAFQLLVAKARSGVAEIFQLQNSFQSLARGMMRDERRLITIAANYDELLRSLPLGVLAVDGNERIHFLNDALLEILGTSSEALAKVKQKALAMVDEGRSVEEWQLLAESNLPKTLLLVVTNRLNQNGEDSGVWVIVTDLTVQKQTNAQLIQASKLATLGEMSTGMAHELNQPLNVIALAATNLRITLDRDGPSGDTITSKLDRIDSAVKRASGIIDHMRAYGRTSGDELERLDVGDIIWHLCALLREQLALINIELVNRVDRQRFFVLGNVIQFEQVIINLIHNARDAVRELETPVGQITIEQEVSNGRVFIRVTDTGPGIPAHALAHIFEPFFTTKPVGKGTGLGGSISYGIVREMHGDIWAENTTSGARITVSLPLAGGGGEGGEVLRSSRTEV